MQQICILSLGFNEFEKERELEINCLYNFDKALTELFDIFAGCIIAS